MNDKKNKKKFVAPESEIVDFANDIITVSENANALDWGNWGSGDNNEDY